MSRQKKPRNKQYRPHAINIPMMRETRDELAMGFFAAVETLIAAPDVNSYNEVSLRLVTLGRCVGKRDCMEAAKQAMLDVFARHERVGKMGVSVSEAQSLRAASYGIDGILATVPLNKLVASEVKTVDWCRANNV